MYASLHWKAIDVLINNAGITKDNLAIRMKKEEWTKVIDVNLTSSFLMAQEAIKVLIKNKSGSIINISSVVAHLGNAGQVNYAVPKLLLLPCPSHWLGNMLKKMLE